MDQRPRRSRQLDARGTSRRRELATGAPLVSIRRAFFLVTRLDRAPPALADSPQETERWQSFEGELLAWPESERAWIVAPPALLSGEEVQALLAVGPGPAVGTALARVRRAQVDGVVRVREEAVALLVEGGGAGA